MERNPFARAEARKASQERAVIEDRAEGQRKLEVLFDELQALLPQLRRHRVAIGWGRKLYGTERCVILTKDQGTFRLHNAIVFEKNKFYAHGRWLEKSWRVSPHESEYHDSSKSLGDTVESACQSIADSLVMQDSLPIAGFSSSHMSSYRADSDTNRNLLAIILFLLLCLIFIYLYYNS